MSPAALVFVLQRFGSQRQVARQGYAMIVADLAKSKFHLAKGTCNDVLRLEDSCITTPPLSLCRTCLVFSSWLHQHLPTREVSAAPLFDFRRVVFGSGMSFPVLFCCSSPLIFLQICAMSPIVVKLLPFFHFSLFPVSLWFFLFRHTALPTLSHQHLFCYPQTTTADSKNAPINEI